MKYIVTYTETNGGVFEIEAESQEEASKIFINDFDNYSRQFWSFDSDLYVTEDEE